MKQYDYTETYRGKTITGKATTNQTVMNTESGTVALTGFIWKVDGVIGLEAAVQEGDVVSHIATALNVLRAQIDDVNDLDRLLMDAGFVADNTVDVVTGFTVTQPGGVGTDVHIDWDVVDPVENYFIQRASASDFSDATPLASGDLPTYTTSFPPGTYYFRIKAQITGMTDSPWSTAMLIVT